ncbi:MAG TPA: NAD(P)H-hydrate dehydratase [Vicinamibacterales bacterium]|jgi:NAD(P)H-hydrate epimerase|nr:NAD(P)H-hydrate dehydratase [Vicinamibacterales bacterium]
MRILNAAQMREADRFTIEEIGIPSLVLMENAGRQVVAAMEAAYEARLNGRVAVLCGRGNNGGDGFVVARTLLQRGIDTAVFVIGALAEVRGDAKENLEILGRLGVTVVEIGDEQSWELHFSEISQCTLIVDAIFGTGLKSKLAGMMETIVADVNASSIPIVSIDLPSGLSADTPHILGDCIDAAMTVTLAAPKLPLVLPPGETHAGDVVIADIGIPHEVIDSVEGQRIELLTPEQLRDVVEPRAADSHKGDFGRVTIVAGSRGKTGASHLAAMGALRSGAGLVTVATPASLLPIVASMAPELMTEPLAESVEGMVAETAIERLLELDHDVIACGPGLGRAPGVGAFVRALLDRATVPLVLDADAITVLADDPVGLVGREERDVIITPHPGEMARLIGSSIEEVQGNRIDVATDFATTHRVYVVLKGHRTVIATPDGHVFINPTGNAGMATGGTGDVLTGMIAAWVGQLLDAEAACRLAVFLHGAAGDLAEAEEGQVAMTATDVIAHLGDALTRLTKPESESS